MNAHGNLLTGHRASDAVRYWREKAGVEPWEDGRVKRRQDCRGTAATRLLNAGLPLAEIANHMAWSVRGATNVIELYARVSPDETDAVLAKRARAERGAS